MYKPKPGFSWNPLKGFPRNSPCFCGSGRKFKKCCVSILGHVIETKHLPTIEKALRDGSRLILRRHQTEEHANVPEEGK